MKKLNAFVILTVLSALSFTTAHAQRQGPRNGRTQFVESFVGKRVLPHEVLHVKRELSLRDYKGQEVESVSVEAMTRSRAVTATLYINNRAVSRPQMIYPARNRYDRSTSHITFPLKRAFIIGQQTKTIQVKFDSVVFVEGVSAVLKNKARQRVRQISKDLYKFQAGFGEQMSLAEEMSVAPRQMRRQVAKVKLTVRALVTNAKIQLCASETRCLRAQTVKESQGETILTFSPPRTPKLSKLIVKTTGVAFIESATVVFTRD